MRTMQLNFHKGVVALCALLALTTSTPVFASTLTCGTSPGAIDFAMNITWYGHACKFHVPDSEDVKTVSADLRRITAGAGDPEDIGIMADSSGKPSGSFLGSASVTPPIDGVCGLRSVTFAATTTITAGDYWLVVQFHNTPDGNNNTYICDNGGGGFTTSDSNTGTWSAGANGSYHFTYIIASSTGGGGGGGAASLPANATTTPYTSAEVQLYLGGYFAVLATATFLLKFVWRV